ncbi:DNA ligase [Candidatus Pacearchaeota archaeon]|nr:DNA ligase [Candidatus Pacearchaeota archaeon]
MTDFLLANRWDRILDPTGWWVSIKLDGHRAHWDGKHFRSRGTDGNFGRVIEAPEWFIKGLPYEVLDGELYAGRGEIGKVTSAVSGKRELDWKALTYSVYDAPDYLQGFELRIAYAKMILNRAVNAKVIDFWVCESKEQLLVQLDKIVAEGGEGLMLRKPNSRYEKKRSNTLLKVKKRFDAEAVVTGHIEGTRPGLCGALQVMNKAGLQFKVASGMTEAMAHNPPPIGTVITYEWELLTKEGIPRPAIFVRIRQG